MRLRAAGGGRPHLLAVVCPRPDYHVSAAGAAGELAPARRFRRRSVHFLPEKYCAIRKQLTEATTIFYPPDLSGSGGIRRDAPDSGWIGRQVGRWNYGKINL
tara:strand:- start:196 stop:501 length:306 start_codon:yes stop_codon:yes gene_type:complete